MNEAIERRLAKCADDVLKFGDELAQAKDRLKDNPNDANASAVSMAREKLEGARRALSDAEAEKAQAEAFIKSTDYKSAVKRISEINKESQKFQDIVMTKIDELYKAIDDLDDLAKEQSRLIKTFKADEIGFYQKGPFRRIVNLQGKVLRWRKDWKAIENLNTPAVPAKHNYTKEQEKAMKERYKPAYELNAMLERNATRKRQDE